MLNLFPKTIAELHNVWDSYNELLEEQSNTEPFGSFIMRKFAPDEYWPTLTNMADNWTAYSMVANLYK